MDEFVPVRSGKLRSILSEPWKLRRGIAVFTASDEDEKAGAVGLSITTV